MGEENNHQKLNLFIKNNRLNPQVRLSKPCSQQSKAPANVAHLPCARIFAQSQGRRRGTRHPGTPTARTSVGAQAKQPMETCCSSIKVPCPSPALDPVLAAARPDRHISQRAFSIFYCPYGLQFQLETLSTHPHLQAVGGRPSATQPTQPTSALTGTGTLQSCGPPVTANQDWCSRVSEPCPIGPVTLSPLHLLLGDH